MAISHGVDVLISGYGLIGEFSHGELWNGFGANVFWVCVCGGGLIYLAVGVKKDTKWIY